LQIFRRDFQSECGEEGGGGGDSLNWLRNLKRIRRLSKTPTRKM
jgi:hypothetical protein